MARANKVLTYVGAGLAGLVLLVLLAILLLGRTDFGTREVGERAVVYLDSRIAGDLRVGRVSGGGILRGAMLHDVVLDDSLGRPFLRADSARLGYRLRSLLGGDVVLNRVELWRPVAQLERMPGDSVWNFERAFATGDPDTTSGAPDEGGLVLFERATVHDGTVVLRTPWEPDPADPAEPADTARLVLEPAAGGFVRVMRFENVEARLPRVLIESPGEEGMLFRIDRLSARALIWDDPLELRRAEGVVTIRDSIVAFDIDDVRLPDSRASVLGRVFVGEDTRLDVEVDADGVQLGDLRWLLPDLPSEGRATGRFRVHQRENGTTLIRARNLELDAPGTRLRGNFGVVTGDTLYFTEVDLHADPLDLNFIDRLIPGDLPVQGLMIGEVRIQGPVSSLRTSGDVRLSHSRGSGWSRARWDGVIDARPPYGARRLSASFASLDPALVALIAPRELWPDEPLTGAIEASGRLDGRLGVGGWLDLPGVDGVSRVTGSVLYDSEPDGSRVDVRLAAGAFALRRLEKWVPALSVLRGFGAGPVHVVSSGDSLMVEGTLSAGEGSIAVEGVFPRSDSAAFGFHLRGELDAVALDSVLESMPASRATGTFELRGQPGDPLTRLEVRLAGGEFMGVPVHAARLTGGVRDDLLLVDSLELESAAGSVVGSGSFGIAESASGRLHLRARADSLVALAPMLAMGVDSTRMRGAAEFEGVLEGHHRDLVVSGTGRLADAFFRGLGAHAGGYELAVRRVQGSPVSGRFALDAERASFAGRRLGRLVASGAIDTLRAGRLELRSSTPFDQVYAAAASFHTAEDTLVVGIESADLLEPRTRWRLARPASLRLASSAIRLSEIELVHDAGGRVRLEGWVPWRAPWRNHEAAVLGTGPAPATETVALLASASAAPITGLVRLLDPESTLSGVLDGSARIDGDRAAPLISAEFRLSDARFQDVALDRVSGRLDYRDAVARVEMGAYRQGRPVVEATLALPGHVGFAPFSVQRFDRPMHGSVRAQAMPAALPAGLFSGLDHVSGSVTGEISVRGTPLDAVLDGELLIDDAGFTVAAAGVPYRDVNGTLRVRGDQDMDVALRGRANGGSFELAGGINFERLGDPRFSLRLTADHLLLARRRDVNASVSGWADLNGRYTAPRLSGRLLVTDGELNLDELVREAQVVSLENPLLLDAVDTSQVGVRRILRQNQNAFLRSLDLSVDMIVRNNVWVRSEDLNAEIAGSATLNYQPAAHSLTMVGNVSAVRGFYNFRIRGLPMRRFHLRDGSIHFVGVPGINPNLDLTGAYRAHTASGDPLDILAVVDGTLRSPRVRLTSDADPPISESDLASYLVFGRPTYALSQAEAQSFTWLASSSEAVQGALQTVTGIGAPVVLGFASSEVEALAGDFGIDYVSISNEQLADQVAQLEGPLTGTRLEIGRYIGDEWFVAFTPQLTTGAEANRPLGAGGRVEWRFHPTWNAELFWEDRWVQAGDPGFDRNLEQRNVLGVFLFREWGY